MGSVVQNLITPTNPLDGANKKYVDSTLSLLVPYSGASTLLNLGSNSITASTAKFTSITSAAPAFALGVDASGNLNTFTVPTATNILPLNNVFTGSNTINSTFTTADGFTNNFGEVVYTGLNSMTSGTPTTTGITAAAPTPVGTLTFSSPTYTMTPSGTLTYACFWASGTFTANFRYFFNFTNASMSFYSVSATFSVCQANTANTAYTNISTAYPIPQSISTFAGYFTPNSNASYTGQIFFLLSNIKANPFSWTAFTYGTGILTVQGNETVSGTLTANGNVDVAGDFTNAASALFKKVGGNSGTNYITINGNDTANAPYIGYWLGGVRKMYMGYSNATDTYITAESSANLNLGTQGTTRLQIDTAGNSDFNSRELRVSQLNSGQCQIRLKGTTNMGALLHANGNELYFLGTASGDWTGNYTGYRPLYINLVGGGCFMSEGLTINAGGINIIGGNITCANQPFCIVQGVAGASVGYGIGSVFGAGSKLIVYQSAGVTNVGTNGWDPPSGAFWFNKTGRWQINWSFYWNNFAAGSRAVLLHMNSSGGLLETRYCALNGGGIGSDTTQSYSTLIYATAGDYTQSQFQSGSGTLYFGGITHTHVTFHFLG